MWKRYIDDIVLIWTGSKQELLDFINFLNSFHPTIRFKCNKGEHYNFNTRSVNFLDTTIYIDKDGYIQTTLYSKPGKLCTYLLPSSSHPGHITKNIPYSLAYRLLRIESVRENLLKNLELLKIDLVSRHYRIKSIEDSFCKILTLNRSDSLVKKVQKECDRIPLIIPFHKSLPNISKIIVRHYKILRDKYPEVVKFLPEPPMVCYTRDKNLRDILVRAKLPPPTRILPTRGAKEGFVRCGKRGDCTLCSHSHNTSSVKLFKLDGSSTDWPIGQRITCTDKNVIYVISCIKSSGECAKVHPQYFGETKRMAKTRFSGHLGTVRRPTEQTNFPVGTHFNLSNHTNGDIEFIPFEKIVSLDPFIRKARESFFIKTFQTVKYGDQAIQHGLNLQP